VAARQYSKELSSFIAMQSILIFISSSLSSWRFLLALELSAGLGFAQHEIAPIFYDRRLMSLVQ
jgi:hypothetical protein